MKEKYIVYILYAVGFMVRLSYDQSGNDYIFTTNPFAIYRAKLHHSIASEPVG